MARELTQYPEIYLSKGMTGMVDFDLSDYEMNDGKIVFAMGQKGSERNMFVEEMTTQDIHTIVFPADFCADLSTGKQYEYDLTWQKDDVRVPVCAPSPIIVQRSIGGVDRG